jgi:hypothetical protein
MSDVLPNSGWEIQIKQRGGKWKTWCYRATETDMRATWENMPSLRRTARLLQLPSNAVIAKYEPPTLKEAK